jgi:hypothetical protein
MRDERKRERLEREPGVRTRKEKWNGEEGRGKEGNESTKPPFSIRLAMVC